MLPNVEVGNRPLWLIMLIAAGNTAYNICNVHQPCQPYLIILLEQIEESLGNGQNRY